MRNKILIIAGTLLGGLAIVIGIQAVTKQPPRPEGINTQAIAAVSGRGVRTIGVLAPGQRLPPPPATRPPLPSSFSPPRPARQHRSRRAFRRDAWA